MLTLRRILKYTPAVVLGLLVEMWAVSLFGRLNVTYNRDQAAYLDLELNSGSLSLLYVSSRPRAHRSHGIHWHSFSHWPKIYQYTGELSGVHKKPYNGGKAAGILIPIVFAATVLAPLAIGPFLPFRFRLWHYLAYTALVAVELAYYLRC